MNCRQLEKLQRVLGNVRYPPSSKPTIFSAGGGVPCIQPIFKGSLAAASSTPDFCADAELDISAIVANRVIPAFMIHLPA